MQGIGQRPPALAPASASLSASVNALIFTARRARWKIVSSIVVERVQVMIERVGASVRHGSCRKRD